MERIAQKQLTAIDHRLRHGATVSMRQLCTIPPDETGFSFLLMSVFVIGRPC
jgi:hypothetical protein